MTEEPMGSTMAQLRHDIDSGRTGSKVAASDPAAAPLGTDDEAGGAPASPATIEQVREVERRIGDAAKRGLKK
jgi:hypothetical protein